MQKRNHMRALIVESGDTLSALAGTRALGEAGWHVGIASPAPPPYSAASRFASRWHEIPPIADSLDGFIDAVAAIVALDGYEVLFPAGDAEAIGVSFCRDRVDAIVPYAEHPTLMRGLDKLELARLADAAGLESPRLLEDLGDLPETNGRFVVKSRLHWNPEVAGHPPRLEPTFPEGAGVAERMAAVRAAGGEPILQEYVVGRLMAVTVVSDRDGSIRGVVQQTTEGPWPSNPGISLRARSVPVEKDLYDRIAELIRKLEWFGLAELQFMRPRTGAPKLIDLNGRLYGSLSLAVRSGVNLPAMWGSLALGYEPPSGESRPGIRYQWLQGDIVRALEERRGGLLRDLFGCLRYSIGATSPIWRKGDLRPTLRFLARRVRRLTSRAFAKVRRS